ncbi:MAG: lysophospholipid acyltransferase family protein [Rhodoferax sp.]
MTTLIRWLFSVLARWPLWALHGLGSVLGWLAFLSSGVYRRRFMNNARQAGYAWGQVRAAVAESGKLLAELPRLWLGTPVPVHWHGSSQTLVAQALAGGRGVVFLTPHLGCFEITAQAYAQCFGVQGQPMTVLYRPPRQAWLRGLVGSARQRPGLLAAPTTRAGVKQLIKALTAGHAVGLLPDQVPPQGLGVMAPFFGRPAYTMTLSARLVQQTGARLLLAWGERLPWGRGYRVHVQPFGATLATAPEAAAAQVNAAMEALVRQCPGQYLWGYARYKTPRPQ